MRAQIYGTTLPINCDKNGWLSHSIEPSSMTPCAFKLQFISYEKLFLRSSHIDKKKVFWALEGLIYFWA